jgi:hypothetical protein
MTRKHTAQEQELADRATLARAWKRWHAEQLKQALAGIHGDVIARLMTQLENLREARALVDAVAAEDWSRVDANTRMVALHETNRAITKLREHLDSKTPIDDALPGQPLRAFQLIRAIIDPKSFPQPAEAFRQTE